MQNNEEPQGFEKAKEACPRVSQCLSNSSVDGKGKTSVIRKRPPCQQQRAILVDSTESEHSTSGRKSLIQILGHPNKVVYAVWQMIDMAGLRLFLSLSTRAAGSQYNTMQGDGTNEHLVGPCLLS